MRMTNDAYESSSLYSMGLGCADVTEFKDKDALGEVDRFTKTWS